MTRIEDLDYDAALDIAQDVIAEWVETGYRTALAGLGEIGDEPARREGVREMRHLRLAEPWLPAVAIVNRLRAAGLLREAQS